MGLGHFPKAKMPNLNGIVAGEPMQGHKVPPFSEALKGDPNSAAIDRHVAMVLFNTRSPTPAQIEWGSRPLATSRSASGGPHGKCRPPGGRQGRSSTGSVVRLSKPMSNSSKSTQDELNAILTKDREGQGRGLQAARRLSERAGQGAGAARSISGKSLGTRAGPEDLEKEAKAPYKYEPRTTEEQHLPGEIPVNDVKADNGGYFLSLSGRLYNIRRYGPTHYDYARAIMGISLDNAFKKGWIRVITDGIDQRVYWDGDRSNKIQSQTLKDIADTFRIPDLPGSGLPGTGEASTGGKRGSQAGGSELY